MFFIDLAQAGAKVPSHSPAEALARQDGEQILNELGYREKGAFIARAA